MRIAHHITHDLRRRPNDPERLDEALARGRQTVARLRARLDGEPSELDWSDFGRQASRLADHLLLAGECEEALALEEEAVEVWRQLGRDKARFLAELDSAEMAFELGRHEEALGALDALVEQANSSKFEVYSDFAHALRGRCRARIGDVAGGTADVERALELRRERGNQRQIDETERLLELVASHSTGSA